MRNQKSAKKLINLDELEGRGLEHHIQSAFVLAFTRGKRIFPELKSVRIMALANGLNAGASSKQRAIHGARAKAEGLCPGAPDVLIAANPPLFIEFKRPKMKLSEAQVNCHADLLQCGHRVEVCYSWRQALVLTFQHIVGRDIWGWELDLLAGGNV